MNLICQEILKNIKAGEAQDEDEILKEISNGNDDINVIPKLRKLIVKIRASPQRKERFDRQSNLYSRNSLNLILNVKTRWNSTYLMLECALKLQEVSNFVYMIYIRELKQSIYKFVFYYDIVGLERDLHKFLISNDEWNIIKELCRVFKVSL